MDQITLARLRLQNQAIIGSQFTSIAEVVRHLGAVQAQDYPGACWSLGLRTPGATISDVEKAISSRQILRTWPMRGTLHFVPAEDAGWMLDLLADRILNGMAGRRRNLDLDDKTIDKAYKIIGDTLAGGKILTRPRLLAKLDEAGIVTTGQRGIHILQNLSLKKFICFGPHEGNQPTFALMDEWVKKPRQLDHDAAITELAKRYFTSHGPAKPKDFAWWSGATMKQVKVGLENATNSLQKLVSNGEDYWGPRDMPEPIKSEVLLLPGFDEYMLGYQDRRAILEAEHAAKVVPGNNGMFIATIVIDGQVSGLWRKTIGKTAVKLQPLPFIALSVSQKKSLEHTAMQYSKYLCRQVIVKW